MNDSLLTFSNHAANAKATPTLGAIALCFAVSASFIACGGEDHHDHGHNEGEVITTVILSFAPEGGGTPLDFEFSDDDGDGGDAPVADDIALSEGNYKLDVFFENRLESPAEDITAEVYDEGEEHQVFLLGDAVDGEASDESGAPLTQSYADSDASGFPLGLIHDIQAQAGSGRLQVVLRHLPPVSGEATKSADLASDVKSGGLSAIGGDTDVNVFFDVVVAP